ncbi:DUF4350 domain-containing protein [Alteraurantiacibacter aquimixticola]|uniref:DUF4350 domain-containing protein n=1 Tax=Alteraurantiacibacter aquimixticola TaxID=2489173 RepID=A0A4T3F1R0_9SPHN|nr:DUF4350 domain-containing protein [Alteraurantiacibacter aquimixticola]TIX51096.1 DUF4350 domain-containing protein [Alteraurantiacibacter aquimixticola]
MSRAANPFSPGKLVALVLVGASAFLLFLYAIGAGWTGGNREGMTAHANSNALNGFSGLVALMKRRGHDVSIATTREVQEDEVLLVLTPSFQTDAAELQEVMESRRYRGPTVVILPKWASAPLPEEARGEAPSDWVQVALGFSPFWFEQVEDFEPMALGQGGTASWSGFGLSGTLPDSEAMQAIVDVPNKELFPLVTDAEGDLLAGYWNRNGYHPELAEAGRITFSEEEEYDQDNALYPLVIVAEPDLMNNYGMADRTRALASVRLLELSMEGYDMPVAFDMTMPGLGSSENLLTLAFRPPFLAATLCLIAALFVVGWRAFRRFGPPVAEEEAFARGKTQLARNGAALIERTRRWHLLGAPYAAMVAGRIASALHIRETDRMEREAAIDAAMVARGLDAPLFSERAERLRDARGAAEMIRAASALQSLERTLKR